MTYQRHAAARYDLSWWEGGRCGVPDPGVILSATSKMVVASTGPTILPICCIAFDLGSYDSVGAKGARTISCKVPLLDAIHHCFVSQVLLDTALARAEGELSTIW